MRKSSYFVVSYIHDQTSNQIFPQCFSKYKIPYSSNLDKMTSVKIPFLPSKETKQELVFSTASWKVHELRLTFSFKSSLIHAPVLHLIFLCLGTG